MDDLFNTLSSCARFDKKKSKSSKTPRGNGGSRNESLQAKNSASNSVKSGAIASRDRTGKRDTSEEKQRQIHREQISAFRRAMGIKISNRDDPSIPDPISTFTEIDRPSWWTCDDEDKDNDSFLSTRRAILRNVELGKWKEPTPIQMQGIPTLMARRDLIGGAPTGSGKSGAFILPALLLSSVADNVYYKTGQREKKSSYGEIRTLIIAPSLELASQLHREVERLGLGRPGGLSTMLLSKTNSAHVMNGSAGGKRGLDILVSTPLRLVDSIEKGLKLNSVRFVVLDEADRLLDAADGKHASPKSKVEEGSVHDRNSNEAGPSVSGSAQTKTFLAQIDTILSEIPVSAVRCLFSATVTPAVRSLSESILRNPVDATIGKVGNACNPDVDQTLTFVSNEHGKLLAIRQLVAKGDLRPPAIVFLQSQERAQALFEEL